jgi:hypothetical protein
MGPVASQQRRGDIEPLVTGQVSGAALSPRPSCWDLSYLGREMDCDSSLIVAISSSVRQASSRS